VFFLLHPRSCASACHAGTGCSPRSPVSASRAGSLCSPRKRRFRFSRSCRLSQAQKSNDTVRASPVHARLRTTAPPFPHPHPNMSLAASTSRVAVRLPTLARVARKSGARAVTTTRASSAETVRNLLPEKPATLRTSVSSSFSARFASSASLRPSRRADARAPVERGDAFARLPRVSVLDANVVVVAFVSLGTRRKTPSVDRRKCFFFGFPKHRRLTPPRARRGSPRVPRRYRSSRSSRSSPSSRRAPRCARWRAGAPSAG
jgi:hypothetical protein